ncbi:hypothetical protein TeGR_g6568 [Tetraparma gracilis]|uniref:Uncharacterized protein n=1 Tax=Tetraparma gracilis TaxID=2962635 RepID=A0ABQ6M3G8_9STRA|nr:hypothetical protein TeGR_g6568 [Tetraparma gracilis]
MPPKKAPAKKAAPKSKAAPKVKAAPKSKAAPKAKAAKPAPKPKPRAPKAKAPSPPPAPTLSSLPQVLLMEVCGYLVGLAPDSIEGCSSWAIHSAIRQLPALSLVSSAFRAAAGGVANFGILGKGVPIDPLSLAGLKRRAAGLDLSRVHAGFIAGLVEKWGGVEVTAPEEAGGETIRALDMVVNHYAGNGDHHDYEFNMDLMMQRFAAQVEGAYRQFLVVKAVEAGAGAAGWGAEKCMATKILDVFWHAHMMLPKEYYADCAELTGGEGVGALIDHEPDYFAKDENSLNTKLKLLFTYERAANYFPGGILADHQTFPVEALAGDIIVEMMDDMYDDEGCG